MAVESMIENLQWADFIPMLVALGLGGLIGAEREISGKAAGLRTNILICVGAAMFTHLALNLQSDAARILSGVITGVGFIGCWAVLQDRGGVHGITTAATIWLVTGIGIACGMRIYHVAVGITVLALIVLVALHPLDRKITHADKYRSIIADTDSSANPDAAQRQKKSTG